MHCGKFISPLIKKANILKDLNILVSAVPLYIHEFLLCPTVQGRQGRVGEGSVMSGFPGGSGGGSRC